MPPDMEGLDSDTSPSTPAPTAEPLPLNRHSAHLIPRGSTLLRPALASASTGMKRLLDFDSYSNVRGFFGNVKRWIR